jgi:hypothetical protein
VMRNILVTSSNQNELLSEKMLPRSAPERGIPMSLSRTKPRKVSS